MENRYNEVDLLGQFQSPCESFCLKVCSQVQQELTKSIIYAAPYSKRRLHRRCWKKKLIDHHGLITYDIIRKRSMACYWVVLDSSRIRKVSKLIDRRYIQLFFSTFFCLSQSIHNDLGLRRCLGTVNLN